MALAEQLLIIVILAVLLFLVLLPRIQRPIIPKPYKPPPTSDGLSMAASKALAEKEIAERNAHIYSMEDIPPDTDRLTLYRYYWEFRGESVGGAYLYPGVRSHDDCSGRNSPAPYYHHKLALWSWDGSHYQFTNEGLQAEVKARFDQMLALLEQNGWRSVSHDDQVTLVHLYHA